MKFRFKKSVLLVLFFTISSYSNSTIWLNPSDKVCKKNNGKVDKHGCKSTMSDAKNICLASGGSLASLEQLKRVAIDCGGKINTYFLGDSARFNSSNKMYQSCYKGKGFSPATYWSSTSALNFPLSVVTTKVYDAYTVCLKSKELKKVKKTYNSGDTKKACESGDAKSCTFRGNMYFEGRVIKKNVSMAFKLYQKACSGGDAEGCSNLGVMYQHGIEVGKNISMAVELYQKACDGKNSIGCYNLGVIYEGGIGVRRNFSKASKLYKDACDSGNSSGCLNLGVMYYEGRGMRRNFPMAATYFTEACNAGNSAGCQNLNRM